MITKNEGNLTTLINLDHGVSIVFLPYPQKISIMVVDQNDCSQFPIIYPHNGIVAWDNPHAITQDQIDETYNGFRIILGIHYPK